MKIKTKLKEYTITYTYSECICIEAENKSEAKELAESIFDDEGFSCYPKIENITIKIEEIEESEEANS